MSDWQWFEDFEKEALARGDHDRVRLRQLHREAYDSSETDPDRALALLAEGRRLALALQEPWWVLLFDHWHVHILLYDKSDYRQVLEPAIHNVLEVRKPQYRGFPQRSWIFGDLIQLYLSLDPRGYAEELEQALNELEAELTPQMDSGRYLFMFHQLDAAANQDRSGDALQIGLAIRAAAQADPVPSTGDHFMIPCYRFLCHHYHCQHDWLEVATCAEAGTDLAQRLGQKQAIAVFRMWQAVVSRRRGARDAAARLFRSATSRMGRLKCPPERDYYDAECTYHELGGDWDKALHVRTRQIEDFTVRGHTYDEFDARRAHLRLLVRLGQPLEPHLSAARAATGNFRHPECYLPEIERIATQAGSSPDAGSDTLEHWPDFTAQMPRPECRKREKQKKRQHAKKDTTEDRIYKALVDLLRDHKETAGIVLIEEPQSGKFVQFGPGASLEMDVPHLTLNREEADRAYKFFAELGENYLIEYNAPDPETGVVRHGATFNHDFGQDARVAAKAAVAFFHEVYTISPDKQLTIEYGPAFSGGQ